MLGGEPTLDLPEPRELEDVRLDAVGVKLAALYPAPNLAGLVSNYGYNQRYINNADELDSRFDEQITSKDLAFFRYSRGITENDQGAVFAPPGSGGSGFGQYPLNQPVRAWSAVAGETPRGVSSFDCTSHTGARRCASCSICAASP